MSLLLSTHTHTHTHPFLPSVFWTTPFPLGPAVQLVPLLTLIRCSERSHRRVETNGHERERQTFLKVYACMSVCKVCLLMHMFVFTYLCVQQLVIKYTVFVKSKVSELFFLNFFCERKSTINVTHYYATLHMPLFEVVHVIFLTFYVRCHLIILNIKTNIAYDFVLCYTSCYPVQCYSATS